MNTITENDAERAASPGRRRRRTVWIAGAVVVGVLACGGGVAASYAMADDKPVAQKKVDASTATIDQGTLSGTVKAAGSLAYADPHDLSTQLPGILTSAPAPGTTVGAGQPLFSVDNAPVYLFHGDLPAWRAFQSGMDDGPDVLQLEQNLKALGYFSGEPDQEFTWSTKQAIIAWQKATGQKQTGSIDLGRVVFEHGDVRVQAVKGSIGSPVGGPVLSVTDLAKQVSVDLQLSNQQLATVGGKVTISLPGGTQTSGTISSVGTPQEKDPTQGTVTIPVVITLDDPTAAASLQQASVTVDFPSETRENVLSVPVGALMAFSESQFGVEVVDGGKVTRIPVKTGLFAGGRVEISGDGLKAGQKVVVPSL